MSDGATPVHSIFNYPSRRARTDPVGPFGQGEGDGFGVDIESEKP